jgi:hypothetical protein
LARFTIRVELHGVSPEDGYRYLHDDMYREGFTRLIAGSGQDAYLLPSYEYELASSTESAAQVCERVIGIASKHQPALDPPKKPWVLVTAGDAAWDLDGVTLSGRRAAADGE